LALALPSLYAEGVNGGEARQDVARRLPDDEAMTADVEIEMIV